MNRIAAASVATLAALAVAGCGGASVTQLWRDPAYRARSGTRVFVVATTPRGVEPATFENGVAQALAEKGFQVATAASVFPPGRLDKVEVSRYVEANGVDLVVMVRISTEKAPPVVVTTTVAQGGGWYGAYGGAVASGSQVVAQGTNVHARIEAFDARVEPNVLVWSGESNDIDLQGAPRSLGTQLASRLLEAGLLVK